MSVTNAGDKAEHEKDIKIKEIQSSELVIERERDRGWPEGVKDILNWKCVKWKPHQIQFAILVETRIEKRAREEQTKKGWTQQKKNYVGKKYKKNHSVTW